jgi:threonine dehydrogenase-like Zn-dependent dehydrogenase
MRGLLLGEPGRLRLASVAEPEVPSECLIRVTLAGICGTDLQLLDGYAAFTGIPGHEFAGVVERAPVGAAHWEGKRVVGEINVGCGNCDSCRRGIKEHCADRTVVGIRGRSGAFAEYLTLPAANLHEIPGDMDDATAVFVEPVAAACRILEQVEISETSRVAVIGDGRLGQLTAQVARTRTAHVVLIGRHAEKLEIARRLAIRTRVTSEGAGDSYDVVIDATGRQDGLARALEIVRPCGTIVLKSTFHGETAGPVWPAVVREVTIVGSRCGPFRPAIQLLAAGIIQTAPLVSQTYPLEGYREAFDAARRELKVLLDPQRGSTTARRM